MNKKEMTIDELASFCKKKGFVFQSSEIYGGLSGFWDFGPCGVELLNNLKRDWWNYFVHKKENIVGIESSIISSSKIWEASGHIENFNVNDYLVDCLKCKKSIKVDKPDLGKIKCECGGDYDWSKAHVIEQMFKTEVGSDKQIAYIRGETAQGMFMNFKLLYQTSRLQLPFGVAQIGKCFRNEIAPRNFLFRCREFHIGEFEFFIEPYNKKCSLLTKNHLEIEFNFLDAETQKKGKVTLKNVKMQELLDKKKLEEWHAYWLAEQILWFRSIGLEEFKIREHKKDELSHYSSATFDLDYNFSFGSEEIAGNANRGQYDLTQHEKFSKKSMAIFDEKTKKNIIPRVIEPTFGIERIFLALLTKAYSINSKGDVILKLPKRLAPIKVAVFPLVKKDKALINLSREIYDNLNEDLNVLYDDSGSVGRRYARQDEIGTPFCITIDGDSVKDNSITIRDRDSTKQIRVNVNDLKKILFELINGKILFEKAGKLI